jgi:hypothetical protein
MVYIWGKWQPLDCIWFHLKGDVTENDEKLPKIIAVERKDNIFNQLQFTIGNIQNNQQYLRRLSHIVLSSAVQMFDFSEPHAAGILLIPFADNSNATHSLIHAETHKHTII